MLLHFSLLKSQIQSRLNIARVITTHRSSSLHLLVGTDHLVGS